MKIKTLIDAIPSIRKIANQDLHAKTLYRVSLLLDRFESELKSYESIREKLIEKYCEKKDGKVIPRAEFIGELEREMNELLDTDIDTEGIKPIEIPSDEDIYISYADLCTLKEFIKIKFEEE